MISQLSSSRAHFVSAPFIIAAIVMAVVAGSGLGAALFGALAFGIPLGTWWLAAAQAHGHAQIFGWAGLMVFGVALHFVPRLRGAPLVGARLLPLTLVLLVGGLALRVIVQPALATVGQTAGPIAGVLGILLALSGLLELAGASVVIGLLVVTGRRGGPLDQRPGFMSILPLLTTTFAALWIALALNAVALLSPAPTPGLVPPRLDAAVVHLGLVGFLVPISLAVSVRTFPLYLWTPVPARRWLGLGLAALLTGLVLRIGGIWDPGGSAAQVGHLLEGAALLGFVTILGVLHRRGTAPNPRRIVPASERASTLLLVPAYVWLGVAGFLQIATGVADRANVTPPPSDLERHVLAAGFVTLLILGMGLRLLPGFMKLRAVGARASWWAAGLGHGAALLRTLPLFAAWLVPDLRGPSLSGVLAVSGVLGILAIGALTLALDAPEDES